MKIQIASDLHTEFWNQRIDILERVAKTDADVIVLAGDIGSGRGSPPGWLPPVNRLLKDRQIPIIKISGNHESYGAVIEEVDDMHLNLARLSEGAFISANPGVVELGGITFIMATLWAASYKPEHRAYISSCMNDYRMIGTKAPKPGEDIEAELLVRTFRIEDSERLNAQHKQFIFEHLMSMTIEQRQRTVVVTHHTPSTRSCMPAWRNGLANGAYHNEFDNEVGKYGPALWIHGHTHGSADYMIGDTRVVANPLGYHQSHGKVFENPEYKRDLVIEV